jgi:GT2 family glycosyltransferase
MTAEQTNDRLPTSAGPKPRVAIVIPAYNEERHIARCLEGIRRLEYPTDRLRTVVVDNGSRDGTREVARQGGVEVVLLAEGLVGAVRNYGVAQAPEAEILAFIDADCIPTPLWLETGVGILESEPRVGAVGGMCMAPAEGNWLEKAWEPPQPPRTTVRSLAASSLIVRRDAFVAAGGFNEALSAGEDDEFSARLQRAGLELVCAPGCVVFHLGWPKTLGEIYRRQKWQGSNQLATTTTLADANLLIAHFLLLAPLAVVALGLILGFSAWATWLPLLLLLLLPALASARRARALARGTRARRAVHLYAVFGAYYLGRAAGLLASYRAALFGPGGRVVKTWDRAGKRDQPDTHA